MVTAGKVGDSYYALPTAVRTLALFYNQDHVDRAGISLPTNWDELVEATLATVEKDGDNFTTVGITYDIGGQGHNWWRGADPPEQACAVFRGQPHPLLVGTGGC